MSGAAVLARYISNLTINIYSRQRGKVPNQLKYKTKLMSCSQWLLARGLEGYSGPD